MTSANDIASLSNSRMV